MTISGRSSLTDVVMHLLDGWWLLCCLLVWLSLTQPHVAHAAEPVFDARLADQPSRSLTDQFAILEDDAAKLTLADVQTPEVAARFKDKVPAAEALNFGYTRSAFWLRLTLSNPSAQAIERMLEVRYPGLSSIEVHQPINGVAYQSIATGSIKPFSTRAYANRFFVFPLTLPAHAQQTLYLRVQSYGPISFPAYLWRPEAFHAAERTDYMGQAWYFGIAAAMLIFNFLLYVALRDVAYLLYVTFVSWMALTIATQTGLAKEFLWNDAPLWSNIAASVGYSMALASLLMFMRYMLDTRKVIPHSDRLILPLVGLYLIAPIGFAISLPTFVKPAAYLYGATGVLILGIAIWCVYKGKRSAYYFVAAFGVLCLAAIASVLRAMDVLPTNYLTIYALQYGSGLEMLVLAFALADRFNEIRVERARAQTEALRAKQSLVENLRLSEQLLAERVKQRTAELDQKNVALTRAMSSLQTVERIARHDLKTPLGSLVAAPNLLRAGRKMSDHEESVLRMMESAASRALRMVNLSLDMFRMESGDYVSTPALVNLADLANSVVQDLRAQATSKNVLLQVVPPVQPVLALAEETLCYSIIANLAKNALEAAPLGTQVTITLEQAEAEAVILQIHNQGAVPQELREQFFAKYATSGKAGGMGLGTYSSQLLARVQGGRLSMATSEETGTTLTLVLKRWPATQDHETEPALAPVGTKYAAVSALSPLRVLLVDDDEFNRLVLKCQLPQPPLEVEGAINGLEALEIVKLRRPDLIVMDIEMPVMGGVEAVRMIREFQVNAQQQPSVIVAYSGNDDAESQATYLAHGFDQCIYKSGSAAPLLALLRNLSNSVDQGKQSVTQAQA